MLIIQKINNCEKLYSWSLWIYHIYEAFYDNLIIYKLFVRQIKQERKKTKNIGISCESELFGISVKLWIFKNIILVKYFGEKWKKKLVNQFFDLKLDNILDTYKIIWGEKILISI